MKRLILWILKLITYILFAFGSVLLLSVFWLFKEFPHVSIEEFMYQINAPITGTNEAVILNYIQCVAIPCAAVLLLTMICMFAIRHHKKVRYFMRTMMILVSVFSVGFSSTMLLNQLDVLAYYNSEPSDFMDIYYVDPANTSVTFPEEKRNLLMIYLESMELTYADESVGGAWDENLIPELTQISMENENFSASDSTALNGAVPLSGTTWTIGALFGTTSGLPLNLLIDGNTMDGQASFFPTITTMGDILEQNGYRNVFLCGSDAVFGGRQLYFQTHGNYEIYDYFYYLENGSLPSSDYKVFWGFEDSFLLSFAKDQLDTLSAGDEPFNLTMLTVDTHFEDGYLCDLCEDEHDGNRYANVMSCSSRQISAFLDWCKEQSWYENTTIVITGDHLTMDADFCDDVSSEYERKVLTTYINAAAENPMPDTDRYYSSFDTFPTTLAALGASIEGNRLGLGTNLFSEEPTLLEQMDKSEINSNLSLASDFLSRLGQIETSDDAVIGSITVTADEIVARSQANIESGEVQTVYAGEEYEILSIKEVDGITWYRTRDFMWIPTQEGDVVYTVNEAYDDGSLGTLTVLADTIYCRDGASLSNEIITAVAYGESYDIFEIVSADGYTWYCAGDGTWIPSDGSWISFEEK